MRARADLRLVLMAVLFAGAAIYLQAASRPEQLPARESLAAFPMALEGWRGTRTADLDADTLRVLGVDDYISRIYAFDGGPVLSFYVGYYDSQRQGDTIHSPLNCLPGAGWMPVSATRVAVEVPGGAPVEVNHVLIQKGDERQVALYWYQGRGRTVASEYWSKAFLVWDAATRNRTDGALVRVAAPIRSADVSGAVAESQARAFVRLAQPRLAAYLPQ